LVSDDIIHNPWGHGVRTILDHHNRRIIAAPLKGAFLKTRILEKVITTWDLYFDAPTVFARGTSSD